MAAKDRRQRFLKSDQNYDPLLAFNVDEYLMKQCPHLSAKQRKAVWVTCQKDISFDWSSVEAQVDQCVQKLTNDVNNSRDVSSAEVSNSVPPKRKS